jgi:hypothetical protein
MFGVVPRRCESGRGARRPQPIRMAMRPWLVTDGSGRSSRAGCGDAGRGFAEIWVRSDASPGSRACRAGLTASDILRRRVASAFRPRRGFTRRGRTAASCRASRAPACRFGAAVGRRDAPERTARELLSRELRAARGAGLVVRESDGSGARPERPAHPAHDAPRGRAGSSRRKVAIFAADLLPTAALRPAAIIGLRPLSVDPWPSSGRSSRKP